MTTRDRSSPIFYVTIVPDVGGTPVRVDDFEQRVLSFKYEDEETKADRMTITIDNFDLALFDDPAFKHGMFLDVTWGYPGNMTPIRRCVVTSIKGGKTLTVVAVAKSILMAKIVRVRAFNNVRYSDIARTIALEGGYGDEGIDVEETSVVHETVSQARLSDAHFLRKLADIEGFEFYVDHEGFHFHRRRVDQAPIRTLTYYIDQEGGDIVDFSIDNDLTKPKGRHRRKGRDEVNRENIDEEASNDSDPDRVVMSPVNPVPAPPATRPTAPTTRTRSVITFDHDTSAPTQRCESEDVAPTSASEAESAQNEARGANRKARQATVKMKLTIIGDPYLNAKTVIAVNGMGTRLSGRYYIKRSITTIQGDYKHELEVVGDGHNGHATRSRVSDLELPAREEPSAARQNTTPEADPNAFEPIVTFDHDTSTPTQTFRPRTQRRP